jgi:hypothetical protein
LKSLDNKKSIEKRIFGFDGCDCRHIFATLSFVAETFIFLYVGMDALDMDKAR